ANAANAASRSSSVTPGGSGRVDVAEVLLIFSGLLRAAVWVWCVSPMVRDFASAFDSRGPMVQFVHRSVHELHHHPTAASGPLPTVVAWGHWEKTKLNGEGTMAGGRLEGKVVLLTGIGGGMGRETARL